jgi:hypothetical protein
MTYKHGMNPNSRNGFKKGDKLSQDRKDKISAFMKGRIPWNKGLRYSIKKEYKTSLMRIIRNSEKFKNWREIIFQRDNYICQKSNCKYCNNKRGVYLHSHHIKFLKLLIRENKIKTKEEAFNCENLWNTDNGITYCRDFHLKSNLHKGGD